MARIFRQPTMLFIVSIVFCAVDLQAADRPNILLVMADDLGFSDVGCYGSEIETPTLDRLANEGVRFSQFYNTAKCHSSRICLLTGRYPFQAGNKSLNRSVTLAEALGQAGYFTAMCGKWHLDRQPTDFGFQRYFGHLSGACNYFRGDSTFRLNGAKWNVPEDGFYTTIANVDFALQFLQQARDENKPWFLYVAFNAPHAPLQPLEADYKKYLGKYDSGWDLIHQQRAGRQRAVGLFGKDVSPAPRPSHIPPWDELDTQRQSWESRRMTAYAGMIDRIDQELARLVSDLSNAGELQNTLIMFVSDNGACPYDRRSTHQDSAPYLATTRWSDSTGWAWARNTPLRFYKQNQFEGGIATPAIIHWPSGLKQRPGSVVHAPHHLIDVLPTMLDLAQASSSDSWPGRDVVPVSGVSFANVLAGESAAPRPPIYFHFSSDRAIRSADWKAVSFRSNPWELYNLAEDRSELHDLAKQRPKILERLVNKWHQMAEQIDESPARHRGPVSTKVTQSGHPEWTAFDQPLGEVGKRP